MKRTIAIPTLDGKSCAHFGHCEAFAFVSVEDGVPGEVRFETPPPHTPGSHPRFLIEKGVDVVIAGGMGGRAQQMLRAGGIEVVVGAPSADPNQLVRHFLAENLELTGNACSHDADKPHECKH